MKRVAQLDGVRGLAVLMVIVWHYFACQIVVEPRTFLAYLNRAVSLTWSGVDLFFVLSGFLIAGLLLDHRGSANYFPVFYLRRACRIFPLYFLVLAVFALMQLTPLAREARFEWLLHHPFPLWSYATFTQNIFMAMRGDYGPHWLTMTWSLAVEEQFYLVVPLLIYFLPRKWLALLLGALVLAAPLLRWKSPGFHAFVSTPWRADSLLSGAVLAMAVRHAGFLHWARDHRRWLLATVGVGLAGAGVLTLRADAFGPCDHLWLAALYSAVVLLALVSGDSRVGRWLGSPTLVWWGKLSFGIYMLHEIVSGLLHGFIRGGTPEIRSWSDAGVTLLALAITLGLAAISFRFFEGPFLRLGHRWSYRSKPGPAQ